MARVCGSVALWLCGSVALWLRGEGLWLCGRPGQQNGSGTFPCAAAARVTLCIVMIPRGGGCRVPLSSGLMCFHHFLILILILILILSPSPEEACAAEL